MGGKHTTEGLLHYPAASPGLRGAVGDYLRMGLGESAAVLLLLPQLPLNLPLPLPLLPPPPSLPLLLLLLQPSLPPCCLPATAAPRSHRRRRYPVPARRHRGAAPQAIAGFLLPQPLLAVLLQQSVIMWLLSRPALDFCSLPLFSHPLAQPRFSRAAAVLDSLPTLLAGHLASATGERCVLLVALCMLWQAGVHACSRRCAAAAVPVGVGGSRQGGLGPAAPPKAVDPRVCATQAAERWSGAGVRGRPHLALGRAGRAAAAAPPSLDAARRPPPPSRARQPPPARYGMRRLLAAALAAAQRAWRGADVALTELCTCQGYDGLHLTLLVDLALGNVWMLSITAAERVAAAAGGGAAAAQP